MEEKVPELRKNNARAWLVFIGCAMLIMGAFTVHGVCTTLLVAPVCDAMGYSRAQFTLGISIGSLLQIISAPLVMKVLSNKKIGSRGVISIAILLLGGMYFWLANANSLWQWQVGLALNGPIQCFCCMIPVQILLNNWFSDKVSTMMGAANAMTGVSGAVLSPFFANIIAEHGWRAACTGMGIAIIVLSLPLAITILRLYPSEIGLLPYTSNHRKEEKTKNELPANVGFTRAEALKSPVFYLTFIATVLFGFSAAINTHAPALAAEAFGLKAMGAMVGVFSVCVALGKVFIGILNDKFGIYGSAIYGVVGMCGGIVLMMIASGTGSVAAMYIAFALVGLGSATNTMTAPFMCTTGMGRKHFGEIYGMMVPAFVIGVSIGIPVSGVIYDVSGSYNVALTSIIIFSALAAIFAIIAVVKGQKILKKMETEETVK